jgi:hypothetical protein
LQKDFCIHAESTSQKPAEIRYLELADYPLNDFITVIQHSIFKEDGSISLEEPTVQLVRKTGVTWRGQPVAPSNETGFPLERLCTVSSQQGHPDGARDDDVFNEFVTAGRCPIVCTLIRSLDEVVPHSWLPKDKRKEKSIAHLMENGNFFIAYKGPRVGKEANGRAGIPFLQSLAIEADDVEYDLLQDQGISELRVDGARANDEFWRLDKNATYVHLESDTSDANGLWILTTCLPLPEGHGIPGNFKVPCRGLSIEVFLQELARESKKPIGSFSWLTNKPTVAWFRAANIDEAGNRMATQIMSLKEQKIAHWLKPFLEGTAVADIESHKLWIHPLIAVIHQMYIDWWLHESNPNKNMQTKFKRFVDSALNEYTTDPAPLGKPSAEGATFLLTLYKTDVKSWCDQYFPALFRSTIFLAPYITNYSSTIRIIQSSQRNLANTSSQPLLSPQEKAKRNQEDDDRTTATEKSMTSEARFAAFFGAGLTPPADMEKVKKLKPPPQQKRQKLFDDTRSDYIQFGTETEEQGVNKLLSSSERQNIYSQAGRKKPPGWSHQLLDIEEEEYQRSDRDGQHKRKAPATTYDDVAGQDESRQFGDLPKLQKAQAKNKTGIPRPNRVNPGLWRTPAITRALESSGLDYFDATEVEKADSTLRNAIKPPASAAKSWASSTKESPEDSKKQALPPGAFDIKQFIQQTMNPLQNYVLFACASRPANPAGWKIVTRTEPEAEYEAQYAIEEEDLTFPGFMSAKAGKDWTDKKSNQATPQAAISELIRLAHQASRLRRGPVRACFEDTFHKAVGRVHLFHYLYVSIEHAENTENCWSALHWMQSAHNHQSSGQQQLRLPSGGYSAKAIRDTARNVWWFHNLLAESGEAFSSIPDGRTNFSMNGLLSDKLLYLSRWIEAESAIDTLWSENLTSDRREKISAHFCTRLSDLLDIFQRWMDSHPHSEPTRCVSYQKEFETRQDLFLLDNTTITKQGKRDSVSVDLQTWQDEFERDFSEAHLQTTALDWPPLFPNALKPQAAAAKTPQVQDRQLKKYPEPAADRKFDPDKGGYRGQRQQQQQQQQQPAPGNKDDEHTKRPGEYLIADIPALRLKTDYVHEIGATFNIAVEIKKARNADATFPDTPKINNKLFCFRFMTAKCGCRTAPGGGGFRQRQTHKPCDRFHLDLAAKSHDSGVPREALEKLIAFVQTPPLSELIEPTPELQARAQK